MDRKAFIKSTLAMTGLMTLQSLKSLADSLPEEDVKMPVLFVGHGSPMNAIENNEYTLGWQNIAKGIPTPKAILCVSAHWLTRGTFVTSAVKPETIHDFGGFPDELFAVQYPAPGNPELAKDVSALFTDTSVGLDPQWGFDHGSWSVVKPMYPQANIPMIQLSIDYYQPASYHYELAKHLSSLRKKGVLIIGSGNMVHNLGMVSFNNPKGYDWAIEINEVFKQHILNGHHKALMDYEKLHAAAKLAIPTPDHYYPLMYALALQDKEDQVSFFNDQSVYGSLTMTSVKIGS